MSETNKFLPANKKYCDVSGCRKKAKAHFWLGYLSKQPRSMCKRHFRNLAKKINQQIKERPELSYES